MRKELKGDSAPRNIAEDRIGTSESSWSLHDRQAVVSQVSERLAVANRMKIITDELGDLVQLSDELGYLPAMYGNDTLPVPLYYFIEVVDEMIDHEILEQELPSLTYSQIGAAFQFIRRVCQINTLGVDIDDVEEQLRWEEEDLFPGQFAQAVKSEGQHVLNQ